MTLTASERKLFPENIVSPLTAIGMKKPMHIIDYELNVNDCPHINEKNRCNIYDRRPLVCRAFPYVQRSYSVKCPALAEVFKKKGLQIDFPVPDADAEADQRRERYFQNRLRKHWKKGSRIWLFDLTTKQWKVQA